MLRDELGSRMKGYYEDIPKIRLTRRTPVIIRIDGKAFHTFTRGFKKPFDDVLIECMQETMRCLCEGIQGCVLGYTQSDEISLVLVDYNKLDTAAWFGYAVQKMCSVSASMATMHFNKYFTMRAHQLNITLDNQEYVNVLLEACKRGALFDSRVFNIPKEEVANYFYWRQLDASRNSIQMVGQANFSSEQLRGKSGNKIQDMLMEKGINWNDLPVHYKRGSCAIKTNYTVTDTNGNDVSRSCWVVDKNIPIFSGDSRYYIERYTDI